MVPNIQTLIDFLLDDSRSVLHLGKTARSYCHTFLKCWRDEDTVIIYRIREYARSDQDATVEIKTNAEYAGFYSLVTDQLYDLDYETAQLFEIPYEENVKWDSDTLKKDMLNEIRERVIDIITKSPEIVMGKEKDIEDIALYAKDRSTRAFFENKAPEDIKLTAWIEDRFRDSDIIEYVNSHDAFIEKCAAAHIESKMETLAESLATSIMARKMLEELNANTGHIYHRQRDIAKAVADCKTVKVTILKDGIEFTFTTEASGLSYPPYSSYNSWNLKASDREQYKKLYGYSDYTVVDIVRITYGKKTIYERGN